MKYKYYVKLFKMVLEEGEIDGEGILFLGYLVHLAATDRKLSTEDFTILHATYEKLRKDYENMNEDFRLELFDCEEV